jgi:hypothetical protein
VQFGVFFFLQNQVGRWLFETKRLMSENLKLQLT